MTRHSGPSAQHEHRAEMLATVAMLAGFGTRFILPDATAPDVLFMNIGTGSLFLGDAKHTERPSNIATIARLAGYLWWLQRHLPCNCAPDYFAVCHPERDRPGWTESLTMLISASGILTGAVRSSIVVHDVAVTWVPCYGALEGHKLATTQAPQRGRSGRHTARP